jgi:hypothetical protein
VPTSADHRGPTTQATSEALDVRRLRATVGGDVFTLERGDSISYPSHVPHFWETLAESEMLWVATPPSW